MKTIWKYEFPIKGYFELSMPKGAKILTAFDFKTTPSLWAEVDTKAEKGTRKFTIAGTGYPMMEDEKVWIATFPMSQFIWHLYEIL
jgi:hypothetical protein